MSVVLKAAIHDARCMLVGLMGTQLIAPIKAFPAVDTPTAVNTLKAVDTVPPPATGGKIGSWGGASTAQVTFSGRWDFQVPHILLQLQHCLF